MSTPPVTPQAANPDTTAATPGTRGEPGAATPRPAPATAARGTRATPAGSQPITPAALLRRLVAADPGRPRVTVYDDTDSATRGERIELSARVLANWVAKAANLLRDDLDAGPGTVVLLDLPPHWRTLYWAFAAWSVGACVEVPPHRCPDAAAGPHPVDPDDVVADADVVITDAVDVAAAAQEAVLVTLAGLARSAAGPVPPGVVDEARELATHGDVFDPWDEPSPRDRALRAPGGGALYGDLVPFGVDGPERAHTSSDDTAALLRLAVSVWAADGSVVITRGGPAPDVLAARLEAEGVTRSA